MFNFKKIIVVFSLFAYLITAIVPQNLFAYSNYSKSINLSVLEHSLSDGLLVNGISNIKQEEFLTNWAIELRKQGFTDTQIIETIQNWAKTHNDFFVQQEQETTETAIENTIAKSNKLSFKGYILKVKDFFKDTAKNVKTIFTYKYTGTATDLDSTTIKQMESNVKYFPFIQLMLGFDLYSSFSTVFMQSNGYTLPFISLIISLLSPISFASSAVGGIIGDKISKRTLVVLSLTLHTLGSVCFAFSGVSPVILIAAQILPTLGISGLMLSLSPFLYGSLEKLNDKEKFKEIYGANLSLFWIIMSVSSLIGGALAALTSQFTVIVIAALLDIGVLAGSFLFTHKVNNDNINNTVQEKQKFNTKQYLKNLISPVLKLSSSKNTLALAITNFIVNNIFFVVVCFFIQPVLIGTGLNVGMLAPIYFAANMMQSIASNLISKTGFIVENTKVRGLFFATTTAMFTLFITTGQPIFFIIMYISMNFWQGTSSLTEISSIYKVLDDNMRSKWLALKSMTGTIISSITQLIISGLLAIGISNNVIISSATIILIASGFIIPKIIKPENYDNNIDDDVLSDIDLNKVRTILSNA